MDEHRRVQLALAAALMLLACCLADYGSRESARAKSGPPAPAAEAPEGAEPLSFVPEAQAAPPAQVSLSSSDLPSGGLMAVRDGVKLGPFVLDHTDVKAEVVGAFASVEVSQRYVNPHKERLEAIYTFPLPDNAAVTDMFMRIGDRVVTSEVHEREKAKRIYDEAKSAGRTAALLDQERPNIFTQSVANLEPGTTVFVHIRYVHEVAYDAGRFRFVFPMVVGPRFIPGSDAAKTDSGLGWSKDTDRVPDASRITPQPLMPGERSGHDIDVRVDLQPGLRIGELRSVSHRLNVARPGPTRAKIRLAAGDTIPNKDFILEWRLKGSRPEVALTAHRKGGDGYWMLFIAPQPRTRSRDVTPKEMVFVVDTSGSMSGEPIAKAKQAMRRLIAGLNPGDWFEIIDFDNAVSKFSPEPVPFTPENARAALSYINGMNGHGGTNMNAGIAAALDYQKDSGRRRFAVFLTDGFIGNESEILSSIQAKLGNTRLFAFGVGSSVNRYLLTRMAQVGRGFAQFVRHDEDPVPAIELFYKRLRNPLLMDIRVDWGKLPVADVEPAALPDLFDSQPLYLFGRYSKAASGTVRVRGTFANRPFERTLHVRLPAKDSAHGILAPLWARHRIETLMSRQRQDEDPQIAAQVTDLGLRYKLMTKYTSFVAVERKLARPNDVPLQTVLIPGEMPEGVSMDGVFGKDTGTLVSIPRMKPGDPVLSIAAPPGTVAVIARFPFGHRQLCRYDAERERWVCRFLVPRGVADGRYTIRITCIGPGGSRTPMLAHYTVDSKAPVLEVKAERAGGAVVFRARPKSNVLELARGRRGEVLVTHDIKRLTILYAGKRVPMRLERRDHQEFVWSARIRPLAGSRAVVEAVDFAGNFHRQVVALP
ncbi:MAG: VIT domain-containing protein [Elusimicrobia bacterium]|nr:VIT domain-containing protein [Elusimicrobiota bacterium]